MPLSDLLRDAGMQMGAIFDDAKIDARVRQAVWERRGSNQSLEQQVQSVIDEYNAEQREIMDNPPEPAGTPQPIPAEESVTGEPIPAEDPLAVADNNPETGDFRIPTMPTQQDERGRGLKDNKYAETGNGSVIGMVDPNTVKPCPEVQQFKTMDTAAGRTEAREDGTVRDLPGKWNPLADPVFILRRKNGELQIISGRHRLAHAKKNGAKYIKAEVWDESEKFDIAWARRQDVAHNILQGTANATDIAVFFRGNPITYEEADALGFIQKKKNGEDTKASVMGITIALHASGEIYTRLVNGKIGEATAFQLASMFPDNERRQLEALDHYESGESWTSIAWYVNSSVEDFASDGLTQGNLFGEDESAGRRKLADYVGKVEKRIRALINVLKDAKRIQRNPSLARELNFNFSTETDVIDTRTQLEILLDAYQHPKQGEMEEVKRKAAAWDGKSPVNPTLSELIGEAKLLVPYSTAESAPVDAMDDLFATAAIEVNDDFTAEVKSIREQAMKDGTFMKAPNGKPSTLTEPQWLAVRTTAFKNWFGDWETVARFRSARDAIMNMPAVTDITGNEFQRDGVKLTDKVTAYWKEKFGGKATSPELGDVSLDIEGVKSSIGHGIGSLKAAAFYAVPMVIQNGKVFNRSKNWKNRGYDTAALAAPITIAGKEYICEIVVEQRPRRQGFYLHEVVVKEKLGNVFKTSTKGGTRQASRSILARWNDKVNTIFENCSKVVDENGEPLVVYHFTDSVFTAFDVSKARQNADIPAIFFSSATEDWAAMGGRVMACYLNIRNPKEGKPIVNGNGREVRDALVAEGYDGTIDRDEDVEEVEYAAFRPEQVKSATENRGTFDANSGDITLAISTSNPDDIAAQYANARKGSLAHRMMHHARAEANRFRRVLRKPTTDAEAAQDLASVLIFMETAMRYVPTARIPRMTARRNALEAYIKMMQQGRIGVNRDGTIRRAGLTQEQIDAVAEQAAAAYEEAVARQDILPENKLTKEQAKNLQREFIRAAARNNIGTTIAGIYEDIATSIATALSDKLIDRMHTRIGQLQPKVSANRKPLQAKVRPDAFRDIAEISRIMELSQADFEKEREALYAEYDTPDISPERTAGLDRKVAMLQTYGALHSRTYGEVQTAYADLMAYIATERHLWQDILEQRDQQLNQDLQNFYDKVDPETGDAYNRQRGREKLDTFLGQIGVYARSIQSPSQLFAALSGHAALKRIAKATLDGISNGNNAIMAAEHRRETAMLSAYAQIFGIKPLGKDGQYTDRQLNRLRNGSFADFTQDILQIKQTGITRRYIDDATGKEVVSKIEANDGQLMNLILMAEQEHYKGNAEKWGYTEDVLAAIKNHLGARKLAFAYALRSILQSDNLPGIFEDRTGIPMPEDPLYWPGHLDLARLSLQESAALMNNYSKGGTYGMLRNRVKNNYDTHIPPRPRVPFPPCVYTHSTPPALAFFRHVCTHIPPPRAHAFPAVCVHTFHPALQVTCE